MERREHDRRIDDIDLRLCKHLKETEGIVGAVAEMKSDIKTMKDILESLDIDSLKLMGDVTRGAVSFKKLVVGIAVVLASLIAIGSAVIWFIKQAVK